MGSINLNDAISYGVTGPVIRSVGVKKDMRFLKSETYAHYWFLSIQGYLGKRGDSYDRFLIRLREMYESVNIVFQILTNLTNISYKDSQSFSDTHSKTNFFNFFDSLYTEKYNKLNYNVKYTSMETLINHFRHYGEGVKVPRGFTYKAVEAPKGEFGVFISSDGSNRPYRVKLRAPGYYHLQGLDFIAKGHLLADVVTIIGTLDIVFGEVDR